MNTDVLDVIVVGAGQAGLSASYYLKNAGLTHIVFERGKIGETWISQRWDSFKMNTVNRLNALPVAQLNGYDPEAFCTHVEFVASLKNYVSAFELPVLEDANVLSIEKPEAAECFSVTVSDKNSVKVYYCLQIIIASGIQNSKKIPPFANHISACVKQLHTSEYRNSTQLPEGAVLVVGSAQSGCQIAEDLLEAGRKVNLSTSMVGRVPRRYRGKDIMEWLQMVGFFDAKTEDVTDPKEFAMKPPQLTGTGAKGRTISLQKIAQKGAAILGRMENVDYDKVFLQPNAGQHVRFADMFSEKVKRMIDGFIEQRGLTAPPSSADAADVPDTDCSSASSIIMLNLKEHNINSIIWATGFCGNFSYIKLPVVGSDGNPKHRNGISDVGGLYFLGFPWLRTRKSSLICGINEDAQFICQKVYEYSRQYNVSNKYVYHLS